ncbi:MAG: hypothetical protein ACAH88_09360 [Roseimicrobium sp.]
MKHTSYGRKMNPAMLILGCLLAFSILSPLLQAEPASFVLNDRVQTNANGLGWITGTIIEIGKGDHEGKVKVHADGYPNDFWVRSSMESAIRKLAGETAAETMKARANAALDQAEATTAPRLGKYLVMSYGASSNPLHLGYLELIDGGNYRYLNMGGQSTGEGQYAYDGSKSEVRWVSGPVLANKWGGTFDISREGKTHTIRFTRGTAAHNSTDSK